MFLDMFAPDQRNRSSYFWLKPFVSTHIVSGGQFIIPPFGKFVSFTVHTVVVRSSCDACAGSPTSGVMLTSVCLL